MTFLRETSGPLSRHYTLPASGRQTIYVNGDVTRRAGTGRSTEPFSTVVRQTGGGTSADLVVERAMYWNEFEGGHGSAAVTAPSTTWLFAEGVCGGDANFSFQTYLLLANPGTTDATATITFFRDNGGPVTKTVPVPAGRRQTLYLNDLRFDARQRRRARQRLVLDPRVERSADAGRARRLLVVVRHHLHRRPQLARRHRRGDQVGLRRRHRGRRPAGRAVARFLLPDLERQRHRRSRCGRRSCARTATASSSPGPSRRSRAAPS